MLYKEGEEEEKNWNTIVERERERESFILHSAHRSMLLAWKWIFEWRVSEEKSELTNHEREKDINRHGKF